MRRMGKFFTVLGLILGLSLPLSARALGAF